MGVEATRQAAKFGTAEVKLYRDVVTEKVGWKVKLADFCLGIVLFGVHRMYRMRLQGTRVKGVIYLEDFRELLRNLLAEWSGTSVEIHHRLISLMTPRRFQFAGQFLCTCYILCDVDIASGRPPFS